MFKDVSSKVFIERDQGKWGKIVFFIQVDKSEILKSWKEFGQVEALFVCKNAGDRERFNSEIFIREIGLGILEACLEQTIN